MINRIVIILILIVGSYFVIRTEKKIEPVPQITAYKFPEMDDQIVQNKIESFSSFQQRVYQAKENEVVIVDRDVYLHLALDINRNITIQGVNNSKIYIENSIVGFFLSGSNVVVLKDLNILVNNNRIFARADEKANSGLILDSVNVDLFDKSSFVIKVKKLSMNKCSVIAKNNNDLMDSSLLDYTGSELALSENLFHYNNYNIKNGILLNKVTKGNIVSNIITSKLKGLNAPLTIGNSSNIFISKNIIYDFLNKKNNLIPGETTSKDSRIMQETLSVLKGGFAVSISNSNNIFDNETENFFINDRGFISRKSTLINISNEKTSKINEAQLSLILAGDQSICQNNELKSILLGTYLKKMCK